MKKIAKTILYVALGIIGLIIISAIAGSIFGGSGSKAAVASAEPAKQNIDSLINKIKKDSAYHIKKITLNLKDSDLEITISDKEYATEYFYKNYNINDYPGIDGIRLLDTKGKLLQVDSKRAGRLIEQFKQDYVVGNTCIPIKEHIKQGMNDPGSYESDNLWVEWDHDSIVSVTQSFRGKNAFGAMILNKAVAQMDPQGRILSFEIEQ